MIPRIRRRLSGSDSTSAFALLARASGSAKVRRMSLTRILPACVAAGAVLATGLWMAPSAWAQG